MRKAQIIGSVIGTTIAISAALMIPAIAANNNNNGNNGDNGNHQCGGNNGQGQGNICPTPEPTVNPTVPPIISIPSITIVSVGPNGDWLQQFGRPESAGCPTEWSKSWAEWPNDYTGGFVCTRTIPAYGN